MTVEEYRAWFRAKYSADELDAIGKAGNAMKNESGDWSYPIDDHEDFEKAKKAVGRGGSDHDKIRAHVIKVAKKKGWEDEIPDNWNADGSLKDETQSHEDAEERDVAVCCPNCGADTVPQVTDDGTMVCPECRSFRGNADGSSSTEDVIKGDNNNDGSSTSANQFPVGLVDGTGSVSDKRPTEQRDEGAGCGCCSSCQAGPPPKPDDDGSEEVPASPMKEVGSSHASCTCRDEGSSCECESVKVPARQERRRVKPRHQSIPAPNEFRMSMTELRIGSVSGGDIDLVGQPIVYNRAYSVHDMFGEFKETMAPSVCDRVLARGGLDCRFLINHDGIALGRTVSGTLELDNQQDHLRCLVHLDERQQLAYDLAIAIERGDISQMSCGFIVADDEWDDDYMNRTIRSFQDLLDVSAVTYPASPTTSIAIAQRALFGLSTEARSQVQRSYAVACDVQPGGRPNNECVDYIARALEQLYMVNDPRVPTIRVRQAMRVVRDLRAGRVLSAANAGFISSALDALHRADDVDIPSIVRSLQNVDEALDVAQDALSQVSGVENPDADADDLEPTLAPEEDTEVYGREDETEAETRDDAELDEHEARDAEDARRREQEAAAERRRRRELARLAIARKRR